MNKCALSMMMLVPVLLAACGKSSPASSSAAASSSKEQIAAYYAKALADQAEMHARNLAILDEQRQKKYGAA